MRKLLRIGLFTAVMTLFTTAVMAVPAKPGQWKTIMLADGSSVRAELKGDEFCSFWKAEDGRMFRALSDDVYEEVTFEAVKEIGSTKRMKAADRRRKIGEDHDPYVGTKKCLCILVEYQDTKFKSGSASTLKNMVNKVGYKNTSLGHIGSVRDYFLEQSDGKFDIDFDVVGPYTLSKNFGYYGANAGEQTDPNAPKMIEEAVDLAVNDVNFKDYDWNGDGQCEAIYVIYAGKGEADGGVANTIWPHQSSIWKRADGVRVANYACGPELNGQGGINGIGTMCHEYSHILGFPDMYDICYNCKEDAGTAYWDVMNAGSYLGNSNIPCAYNAYERWYAGWREPIELKVDTHVEGLKPLTSGGESYIMYNDGNRNEYYLIENRAQENFDYGLYGAGLMIYHVNYSEEAWQYNLVNCCQYRQVTSHPRFALVPADNSLTVNYASDIEGDAYPYTYMGKTNNSLTDFTAPAAKTYNENVNGQKLMSKAIVNITRGKNRTISFDFKNTMSTDEVPEGELFYEGFTSTGGTGGNDGSWTPATATNAKFDRDGWTYSNVCAGMQCLQLGTATMVGTATSPLVEVDGLATLTFKAAAADNNNRELQIKYILADGSTVDMKETVPYQQWQTYKYDIKTAKATQFNIQFRAPRVGATKANRIFLDEIHLVPDESAGISEITLGDTSLGTGNGSAIFNLSGQRIKSMGNGVNIIRTAGGKVVKVNY